MGPRRDPPQRGLQRCPRAWPSGRPRCARTDTTVRVRPQRAPGLPRPRRVLVRHTGTPVERPRARGHRAGLVRWWCRRAAQTASLDGGWRMSRRGQCEKTKEGDGGLSHLYVVFPAFSLVSLRISGAAKRPRARSKIRPTEGNIHRIGERRPCRHPTPGSKTLLLQRRAKANGTPV